eukprot:190277_1
MPVSIAFVKCKCTQKFNYYITKPSYHPINKDVVIISTHYSHYRRGNNTNGIYEYNIKTNTFNKIHTYNQACKPKICHGQFIDSKNELYMFGRGELGIFDLNTKIMNTNTESVLRDCCKCPQSTYIPSPRNECHILCDHSTHYKMD